MNIREMKENELLCVVVDLWSALIEANQENIFIDHLKNRGLDEDEITKYIEALNQSIFK